MHNLEVSWHFKLSVSLYISCCSVNYNRTIIAWENLSMTDIFCNFENGLCNSDNIHIWNGIIDRFGKVLISSLLYWSLDYKEQKNMIVHKNVIKCFITLKKIGIKIQMLLHQNIHYGFQTTTKLNRNHFFPEWK